MAKKKPSALDALEKLNEEHRALEERRAEQKRAAALELGLIVIDAGGTVIAPGQLKGFIARIVAIGPDIAAQRLAVDGDASPVRGTTSAPAEPEEARNG